MQVLKMHIQEENSDEPINERYKQIGDLMKTNRNLGNQNIALETEVMASQKINARMKGEN